MGHSPGTGISALDGSTTALAIMHQSRSSVLVNEWLISGVQDYYPCSLCFGERASMKRETAADHIPRGGDEVPPGSGFSRSQSARR